MCSCWHPLPFLLIDVPPSKCPFAKTSPYRSPSLFQSNQFLSCPLLILFTSRVLGTSPSISEIPTSLVQFLGHWPFALSSLLSPYLFLFVVSLPLRCWALCSKLAPKFYPFSTNTFFFVPHLKTNSTWHRQPRSCHTSPLLNIKTI